MRSIFGMPSDELAGDALRRVPLPYISMQAYASQASQAEPQSGASQAEPQAGGNQPGTGEESTENIWEDETGLYEVLAQDGQGRELVARSGNVYLITEYDDAHNTVTQYCSEGPLEGGNYDRKTTGGRQMRSIFGMPSSDLAGDALRRVPLPLRSK